MIRTVFIISNITDPRYMSFLFTQPFCKSQPWHAYFGSNVLKMNKVEISLQKMSIQNKQMISWCVVVYRSLCVYTSAAVWAIFTWKNNRNV